MALDVIRYSGDLKITTAVGGTMTFDTGVNTGTVVITGNLDVRGVQTSITSTNTNIKDNILILNSGETNGYVTLGQSGIGIDRGNRASSTSSATLLFDDTKSWSGIASTVTNTSTYRGVWGLSVANVGSALEVASIRLPTNAPNDFAGRRSLNFLGRSANAVLSVSGQTNYASRVIHDDDIPNKAYVDNSPLRGTATTALSSLELRQGDTSIVVSDDSVSGQPSRITTFIDGVSTMVVQGGAITLGRLSVVGTTLRTTTPNANLILQTSGTGTTVVNNGISIGVSASAPLAEQGVVKLYTVPSPGAGGTGILFKTIDTGPNPDVPVQGELISARKALVFSIIF